MKKVILFSASMLLAFLKVNAQDNANIIITNNSACSAVYGLTLTSPQVYPNPSCTQAVSTTMITIPAGGVQRFTGTGTILPPGVPAPPSGQTYYFIKARIYNTAGCNGSDVTLGEACTGLPQSGTITFMDPNTCQPSCSNIPVTWVNVLPSRVEITIN